MTIPCSICKEPVEVPVSKFGRQLVYCRKLACIRAGLKIVPDLFHLNP
jgi:hypothetical protein